MGPSQVYSLVICRQVYTLGVGLLDLPATPPRAGTGRRFIPLILARPA